MSAPPISLVWIATNELPQISFDARLQPWHLRFTRNRPTTPSLVGVVSDGSRAQIPGATVTATHVATNTAVNVLTDERGQYRTPPLRIGDYEVTVQLDGFRTFVRRGASIYQRFENSLAALYV